MEDKEFRYVVFEHIKGGSRFMILYDEDKKYEDDEYHKVIAVNIGNEDVLILIKLRDENNINSFLGSLPDELRSPEIDNMISNMIKNG